LACEPPADSGLPISHWTSVELARLAVQRGIVKSISASQVRSFLAKRTCDRTRAGIGSHRRISGRRQSSIRRTLRRSVTPTVMPRSSRLRGRTS
jgi:hypothetical protein